MPDSPGADGQTPDRPSFTGFWKGSKDKQAAQSLTFVTSKLGQQSAHGGGEGKTELSPAAKARERRQQVRRAQRQHRQRKANYTQQLEMDVTRLRDDIATVEQELKSLKSQNAAMRGRLPAPGRDPAVVVVVPPVPVPVAPPAEMAFSTLLAPEYTISLDVSANLGTPAYRVHRSSPSSLPDMSSGGGGSRATETPRRSATPASTAGTSVDDIAALEMTLSEAQVDAAINFILGLEHCCWDHMDETCFEHHGPHHRYLRHDGPGCQQQRKRAECPGMAPEDADAGAEGDEDGGLNGHTLMATALALQGAPLDVFARIGDLQRQMAAPSTTTTTTTTTKMTTTGAGAGAGRKPLEWPARTLTLANLRRLAGAVNPSDAELAPVQVWFALLSRCGAAVATDGAVLAGLGRALAGEVRCVTFGAAVRRGVLEDALETVVGLLPPSWSGGDGEGGGELPDDDGGGEAREGWMGAAGMDVDGEGNGYGMGGVDVGEEACAAADPEGYRGA